MSHLVASEYKCFEDIRRTRPDGSEYWCARELAPVLDYAKWENFAKVIKRAMIACENSGHDTAADFPEVRKIVKAGATTKSIVDYELSRYACYLIVQNGDPRKEVIALGQTYFASCSAAAYRTLRHGAHCLNCHAPKAAAARPPHGVVQKTPPSDPTAVPCTPW